MVRISFEVPDQVAPALRSAVEEISNAVGGRLEQAFSFATEQAFTDAVIGLGALRAAVCEKIPAGNAAYRSR